MYFISIYTKPPPHIVSHSKNVVTSNSVMEATLREHAVQRITITDSIIELMMVLVLQSAINQPVSHNTEAGFTVNVYTEVQSITGSHLYSQTHR